MDLPFTLPNWWRKEQEGRVTVLLAMADPVARRGMRNAIGRALTANVIEVDGKANMHHAVTFQEFDLIITDADLNGCQSFDIVELIRYGRLHCHAFPIVVMLCPPGREDCALQVTECGADLVLNSDTAQRVIQEHLTRFIGDRRPFVVTPHYIGPERRECERAGQPSHLTVPNPLSARLSGLPEQDYRRQISMASHSVSLMRRGLYLVRMHKTPQLVSSNSLI
jgi:two-component system OmpR family response regulator